MPNIVRLICAMLICLCSAAPGDDVQILDAVKAYGDAYAKAERVFEQACLKPRQTAVDRITKVAQKAYRDGNRETESKAWKYVLALDRDHVKARDYFATLGILEQTLADLPEISRQRSMLPGGRWRVTYVFPSGTDAYEYDIDAAGNFLRVAGNAAGVKGRIIQAGDHLILNFGNTIDRWTPAGNRFLVEHWAIANYPAQHPAYCGVVTRVSPRAN